MDIGLEPNLASRRIAYFIGGFVLSQLLAGLIFVPVIDAVVPVGVGVGAGIAAALEDGAVAVTATLPLVGIGLLQLPLWLTQLATALVAAKGEGGGLVSRLGLRIRPVDIAIGLGAGIAVQIVLVALYVMLFLVIGDQDVSGPARQLTDRAESGASVVLLVVLLAVVAPIVEELFYRGLLLGALRAWMGAPAAILVSAAVFAVAHFQLLQLPGLFVVGVVLGYLTHRFQRLGPAIVAHMVFNGVTVANLVWDIA